MPKRVTVFSAFQQGRFSSLLDQGKSISYIAMKVNRSYNAVKKFKNRNQPYFHKGWAKHKLEERMKRRIAKKLLSNSQLSIRKMIRNLNIEACPTKVSNFLHSQGHKYISFVKAYFLTEEHKTKREKRATHLLVKMSLGEVDCKKLSFLIKKGFY